MISVIIPTYKDEIALEKCLKALSNQTFDKSQFEVLVVNNFPEKELDISILKFPLLKLHLLTESVLGSYAARNKAISVARGEILAFTDSDCIPEEDWLEKGMEIFKTDFKNEIGILTGPVSLFFRDLNRLSDAEVYEKYTGFTTEAYAKEGHAITANWFSYASVIKEFGGFNSKLKSNGDSELSGKISSGYSVKYSPKIRINHPARYYTKDLVNKYKRLMGGTYLRKFQGRSLGFSLFVLNFCLRRYRFFVKKLFTIPFSESVSILRVCNSINLGVIAETFSLLKGEEPKN